MPDRVLVTGVEGFIGRHLAAALAAGHMDVVPHSRANGDLARGLAPAAGVRHVFHLAARSLVPESWAAPLPYYETNVVGTAAVLEFCRRSGAGLTLVSSYVYGVPRRLPIDETHPLDAFNPYSHTKILAEHVCRYYVSQFQVRATIVRPFNVYGPGQVNSYLIPSLIDQAVNPAVREIAIADARPRRDYIHVDDFVRLLVSTLDCSGGGTYNAGSGVSTGISDLVAIINGHLGTAKPLVERAGARPSEVLDVVADISKARRELGWTPRIGLTEGVKALVDTALRRNDATRA